MTIRINLWTTGLADITSEGKGREKIPIKVEIGSVDRCGKMRL